MVLKYDLKAKGKMLNDRNVFIRVGQARVSCSHRRCHPEIYGNLWEGRIFIYSASERVKKEKKKKKKRNSLCKRCLCNEQIICGYTYIHIYAYTCIYIHRYIF